MTAIFVQPRTQEEESVVLGMGEYAISSTPGTVLTCIGLGSCIGICIYDRLAKVGGMVHIVLPRHENPGNTLPQHENPGNTNLARYASTGVSLLLGQVISNGGMRSRLTVKIAGGSQMTHAPGLKDTFKTGERNLAEAKAALEREGIPLTAADVGGDMGRTVKLYISTGKVTVKTVGSIEREI